MTVNITIVFQIINFLIGYYILERFLFRYVIAIVQKRDERMRMQTESLAFQKQSNETLRVHINEQWQRYQRALHSEVPHAKSVPALPRLVQQHTLEEVDMASLHTVAEPFKKILYTTIAQE